MIAMPLLGWGMLSARASNPTIRTLALQY